MSNKYTFISLCEKYDKIEIPIIQRDYAQGRDKAQKVRDRFIQHIGEAMASGTPMELDFIYGNVREENGRNGIRRQIFIPIDGQQRLTTLFLLHWYLAVKENRLDEIKDKLKKFSYETRPEAHDFCEKITEESVPASQLPQIRKHIINKTWFDSNWLNDGTVAGMLQMLQTIADNKTLNAPNVMLDSLLDPEGLISFYFLPLEKFGLSDELYIRMNARGKILTDFENFKSEFYKIIYFHPDLEEIKDKMEYTWVENMWAYKPDKTFVTDNCFMHYLDFVTEMLYFRQAEYRSKDSYANDFTDLNLLKSVYSDKNNTDFLIFALDTIPTLENISGCYLWDKANKLSITLKDILKNAFDQKDFDTDKKYLLFCAITYLYDKKTSYGIEDYLRVTRNLILNTDDKSAREWPRIIDSLSSLAKTENLYKTLAYDKPTLHGLRNQQCEEEYFKAELILTRQAENLIRQIEDNHWFKGNITNILLANACPDEAGMAKLRLSQVPTASYDLNTLKTLYESYKTMAKDKFGEIFGDLLDSSLYTHKKDTGRLVYDDSGYAKSPAILFLAKSFSQYHSQDLTDFLICREKSFVKGQALTYPDFSQIRDVKVQLQLLYIITRRIMNQSYRQFFKNDNWNFGWLKKEKGFVSLFSSGIENDSQFSQPGTNPIFQTYQWQFRYNLGLKAEHALDIETVGSGRPNKAFEKLMDWACK